MGESFSIGRVITTTTLFAALGATGYALYFDYQRRNNGTFRKELKKRAKMEADRAKSDEQEAQTAKLIRITNFIKEDLETDPIPTDVNGKQLAFNSYIEFGDKLAATPGNEMAAAAKFYKALTVYPNPAELLGIYQKSLPEAIYENLVLMIAALPPANISTFLGEPTQAEEEALSQANEIDE